MRWGKRSGRSRLANLRQGRGLVGLLTVLFLLAGASLRAEEPPLSPGPRPVPLGVPAVPSPESVPPIFGECAGPGECDFKPVPECDGYPCGFYLRSGLVRPLGDGFIEERVDNGWMIQVGLRGPLGDPRPRAVFFKEFGLGYWSNDGDGDPVKIAGWFRGQDPPDNHVHRFRDLYNLRLLVLRRVDAHAAVGGAFYPRLLNRRDNRQVHLDFRGGARAGVIGVEHRRTIPANVREQIREHSGHGHQRIEFSTAGINDPRLFFGIFGAFGFGVTYPDARLFGWSLGSVTVALEGEFSHDWFSLGDFARSDRGFSAVTPMATLQFSF